MSLLFEPLAHLVEMLYHRCWHKWNYDTDKQRSCQKCHREETYGGEIYPGDGYWYESNYYRKHFQFNSDKQTRSE